ncbi:PTS sugar transporter subunit IIA [Clostridium neuense]|uniref:PTS sugar transporter subunit IIA n=1 Tax=Clostridium neuense TaxID=1728934 RepID=A0ABW8TJS7_9CLOT
MIKFLLASHGNLADGMYSSVKIIMGEQSNISTLCAYVEENFDLKKEVSKIINGLSCEDKLIVITDVFGGSVNNEFMTNLKNKNIYLISGLNLPLVIELITNQDNEDIDSLINRALESSKDSICYCNKVINSVQADEEF